MFHAPASETTMRSDQDRRATHALEPAASIAQGNRNDAAIDWRSVIGNQAKLRRSRGGRSPIEMQPSRIGVLQRKCTCGGSAGAFGECTACRDKGEATLQRRTAHQAEPDIVPPIVREVLRSPGQP